MRQPSPAQIEIAGRLLDREDSIPSDPAAAAMRIYEKIHLQLSPLLGAAGVHALIVRSLKLTGAAPSSLADLDATAGPPRDHQEQLRRFLQDQGPSARDTAVGLFATFFALLATFVGDRLSTQVLARAWPDAFAPDARKDDT